MFIREYVNYLKDNPNRYWFKKKIFGWGWTPATWQGWAVILLFALIILWMALGFSSIENPGASEILAFTIELVLVISLLIYISRKKGEKPRWKWGFTPEEMEKYRNEI
jgi:uncharacterized membrane protein (DUF2068 family)